MLVVASVSVTAVSIPALATVIAVSLLVLVPFVAVSVMAESAVPSRVLMLVAISNPLFFYEINRLLARTVAIAIAAPVLLVPRRDVKVDGLALRGVGLRHDYDRLRQDHLRRPREVTDVDAAVDTWLRNSDRNACLGARQRRCTGQDEE